MVKLVVSIATLLRTVHYTVGAVNDCGRSKCCGRSNCGELRAQYEYNLQIYNISEYQSISQVI